MYVVCRLCTRSCNFLQSVTVCYPGGGGHCHWTGEAGGLHHFIIMFFTFYFLLFTYYYAHSLLLNRQFLVISNLSLHIAHCTVHTLCTQSLCHSLSSSSLYLPIFQVRSQSQEVSHVLHEGRRSAPAPEAQLLGLVLDLAPASARAVGIGVPALVAALSTALQL